MDLNSRLDHLQAEYEAAINESDPDKRIKRALELHSELAQTRDAVVSEGTENQRTRFKDVIVGVLQVLGESAKE